VICCVNTYVWYCYCYIGQSDAVNLLYIDSLMYGIQ